MEPKDLSVMAAVVVPLIGLVCYVVKRLIEQGHDFHQALRSHMATQTEQHRQLQDQHEEIMRLQRAFWKRATSLHDAPTQSRS